jgi:hypothetical protein
MFRRIFPGPALVAGLLLSGPATAGEGHPVLATRYGDIEAVAATEADAAFESIRGPAETDWPVLAALADPVAGMPLSDRVSCPRCGSTDVASSDDIRLGMEPVREAMFSLAEASSDAELRERVASLASMSAGR